MLPRVQFLLLALVLYHATSPTRGANLLLVFYVCAAAAPGTAGVYVGTLACAGRWA